MSETLGEVKSRLVAQLQAAGIENAECRREAQLIVEHATGWTLAEQVLNDGDSLPPGSLECIEHILDGRVKRVPLQYLTGDAYFMGLKLKIEKGVFIPRTDTEVLVEAVAARLKEKENPLLFEIGPGSGAISIALLKAHPGLMVTAVDRSARAVELTRRNAVIHKVESRLKVHESAWQEWPAERFDAVVSNPPYIPAGEKADLEPEVAVYEPDSALWGEDEDGLGFYRDFASRGFNYLCAGGLIAFEFGDRQEKGVRNIFLQAGWTCIGVLKDINDLPRVILASPDKTCFSNA